MNQHKDILRNLYHSTFGEEVLTLVELSSHASDRMSWRCVSMSGNTCIGTYGQSREENERFVYLSHLLFEQNIPAARVLAQDEAGHYYLQTDLGTQTALEYLHQYPGKHGGFQKEKLDEVLQSALALCARMQRSMDESIEYERLVHPVLDSSFIQKDLADFLNSFASHLYPEHVEGLQVELENVLEIYRTIPDSLYRFCHRDFQLRNLMSGDELSVIDFQDGKRGPIMYDVMSLLCSSSTVLGTELIKTYLNVYKNKATQEGFDIPENFDFLAYGTAITRILQALGGYGRIALRGEKKKFLVSIPRALSNLLTILTILQEEYAVSFPLLMGIAKESYRAGVHISSMPIRIYTFSYLRNQMPELSDRHINFVFDARMFHNPGRDENLKKLTGRDSDVQEYLNQYDEFVTFVSMVRSAITSALQSTYPYSAPLSQVSVYVGCSGGRHRSVYIAEQIAEHLRGVSESPVEVFHPNINAI